MCSCQGRILPEHIVRARPKEDKDINNAALRHPVGVCLGDLVICLEVGQQLPQDVLQAACMSSAAPLASSLAQIALSLMGIGY